MRTARFWILWGGSPVKLALRAGAVLRASRYAPDEEGWHGESAMWQHCGGYVRAEYLDEGRDCDGYLARGGASACDVDRLAAGWRESADVAFPDWQPVNGEAWQRDAQAEAAGY